MIKEKITVHVLDIKVGKRYFLFRFKIWRNGKLIANKHFSSTHSRSSSYMRKHLKNGYAVELALETI